MKLELGFVSRRTIEDGVGGLVTALGAGNITNLRTEMSYYNIKRMQALRHK